MPYISHARSREATRQACLDTFPAKSAAALSPVEQDHQLCQVVLSAVQQTGCSLVLWRLLDIYPALIPQMVGLLDEAGETDLLVELMAWYFPD